MSRTAIYKSVYLGIVGLGTVAVLIAFFRLSLLPKIGLIALLLVPGRILGFFWKDLLRGLHQLEQKNYPEAKRYSQRFVAEIRRKPWLRHFIWLGWSTYSRNPESLALNNLGAAEIGLGELDSARTHLEASIAADKRSPLPYFNIGVLLLKEGNAEAERWFRQAVELGYSRSIVDKIVMASQTRFARREGSDHR